MDVTRTNRLSTPLIDQTRASLRYSSQSYHPGQMPLPTMNMPEAKVSLRGNYLIYLEKQFEIKACMIGSERSSSTGGGDELLYALCSFMISPAVGVPAD
ncbi:hypothetical protein BSLG_010423 [Batrachochytrium salamandrivorans]|nr:hypothetical protein BSLG_010423 [Batrachochytrium salamandrivorans]